MKNTTAVLNEGHHVDVVLVHLHDARLDLFKRQQVVQYVDADG